jgi:hypothetical protein
MVEFQHAFISTMFPLSDQRLTITALETFRIPTGVIWTHARPTEQSQHQATTKGSSASTATEKDHGFSKNSINQ